MSIFSPKVNSIKKSGKVFGEPPEKPEFGQMKHSQGNPSRKSTLSIRKPGR